MRAIGVDPDRPQSPNPMLFVITGVAYFVAAVALGAIARAAGGSDVVDGIVLGLVTSIGLVAAIMWVNASYESRPAALLGINAANVVVGFVVMAVIMTVWD